MRSIDHVRISHVNASDRRIRRGSGRAPAANEAKTTAGELNINCARCGCDPDHRNTSPTLNRHKFVGAPAGGRRPPSGALTRGLPVAFAIRTNEITDDVCIYICTKFRNLCSDSGLLLIPVPTPRSLALRTEGVVGSAECRSQFRSRSRRSIIFPVMFSISNRQIRA
ncbi:hypothetical protein EVAR_65353_1 [Eumeta japonica]|uniref:Uncharacterized protein n=1 Tax=Eumeta variegata TaxID=151549 RepID=A0A4C1Z682_EUMVA|nr:hypothetical protein EVAR_65353_1 [Eumeta japonica]